MQSSGDRSGCDFVQSQMTSDGNLSNHCFGMPNLATDMTSKSANVNVSHTILPVPGFLFQDRITFRQLVFVVTFRLVYVVLSKSCASLNMWCILLDWIVLGLTPQCAFPVLSIFTVIGVTDRAVYIYLLIRCCQELSAVIRWILQWRTSIFTGDTPMTPLWTKRKKS